ncbi:helix-turn-helix domain-containing protein [Lachnospiraceae bacterium 42-17]
MSLFGENLQFYRKRENMTQEQLAERLEVSRQTVSKWEAGSSFAEMEKILQLCDLFSCDMDTLLRSDASVLAAGDDTVHREHMRRFRKGVVAAVVILILACAVYELGIGFMINEVFLDTIFWVMITVGTLILIAYGMQDESYKKKHPVIQDFYTEEEKEQFEKKFPVYITTAVGIILVGMLVFGMNVEYLPLGKGMTEDFYYGLFMICVALAVGIFVYSGLKKDEYDVEKYNKSNSADSEKKNNIVSVWCGCIMLVAVIVFLVAGLVFNLWEICWIAFVIGGLLCGIVSLILKREK